MADKKSQSFNRNYLSCVTRKPVSRVPDHVNKNQAVQPRKMARGLILEVEGLYYVAITKAMISCTFVFAYAKSRFSHDVAHLLVHVCSCTFTYFRQMIIFDIF